MSPADRSLVHEEAIVERFGYTRPCVDAQIVHRKVHRAAAFANEFNL